MNIGLYILLLYITPMLLCLTIGIIINWKDIRTIGDLLFPLFGKEEREANILIYIPVVNISTLIVIIIFGIFSFFKKLFCEWTPISEYVSKFLNTKIK
jgi:hypothetical protein